MPRDSRRRESEPALHNATRHTARAKIVGQLLESAEIKRSIARVLLDEIDAAAQRLIECCLTGRKILLCGNGGSAADAQHLAAELVSRFRLERTPIRALALTTDTSILTAIGNDYGYERTFARQVEAWGESGDVLIAISTSGNSRNVLCAAQAAADRDMVTIALTGCGGGGLAKVCQLTLVVPSDDTPRIQEMHITIGHILCEFVEQAVAESPSTTQSGAPT